MANFEFRFQVLIWEVLVWFTGFGPEEDEWVNVRRNVRPHSLPCDSSECVAVLLGDEVVKVKSRPFTLMPMSSMLKDGGMLVRGCRRFLVRYDHNHSEEIVPLRKVCHRPETDYWLQQLHAVHEVAPVGLQKTGMDPATVYAIKVTTSAETQKQQNANTPTLTSVWQTNISIPQQGMNVDPNKAETAADIIAGNSIVPAGSAAFTSNIITSSVPVVFSQNMAEGK